MADTLRLPRLELRSRMPAGESAGRVVHDHRGNAIWDWAIETGVFAKATADELLRTLADPAPFALEIETERGGWSGDPYNRS